MKAIFTFMLIFIAQAAAADFTDCLNAPAVKNLQNRYFKFLEDGRVQRTAPLLAWDESPSGRSTEFSYSQAVAETKPELQFNQEIQVVRDENLRVVKIIVRNDPATLGPALKLAYPKPWGDGGELILTRVFDISYGPGDQCQIDRVVQNSVSLYFGGEAVESDRFERSKCPKYAPRRNEAAALKDLRLKCAYHGFAPGSRDTNAIDSVTDWIGGILR
jgi:hypothetical protein